MPLPSPARRLVTVLTLALVLASSGYLFAQFGRGSVTGVGGPGGYAPEVFPDGDVVLCRLMYPEGQRFTNGWRTDYPLGERNLSIRLSELTRTRVSWSYDRLPNHYVVRITDDQLFQCPFLMAGDAASMSMNAFEAERLREYLLKGGFLWSDDMWGTAQWETWTREIAKVFPPHEYPIEDVPLDDPIFRSQFIVSEMPQIPNLGFWRSSGGQTSEQGADSAVAVFRAIRDSNGRIMVAMTHNTDIADAFEREADDPDYFATFSPTGYALGINILLHALTH